MCPDDDRGSPPPDGETTDSGEAIPELEMLDMDPSDEFLDRVHKKIDRRVVASQLFTAGWSGLATVFLQYLMLIFEALKPGASRNDQP